MRRRPLMRLSTSAPDVHMDTPAFEQAAPEDAAPTSEIAAPEFEAVAAVSETPDAFAFSDEPVSPPEDDMPPVETVAEAMAETAAVIGDDGEQDGAAVEAAEELASEDMEPAKKAKPRKSAEKKSAAKKAPKKRAARKAKAADAAADGDAPSTDDVGDDDAAGENFVPFEPRIEGPAP